MNDELALFIVIMTALIGITMLTLNIVRGRQRRAEMELSLRGRAPEEAERQIGLLSDENAGLKGKVSRLEDRLATLERIVTDPAERTAREIESLR